MSQFCPKGHDNLDHSQFCSTCGMALPAADGVSPASGHIIGSRYRLQYQLGEGGFGRTYLAEDTHRFGELCVLKEFSPYVEGDDALHKAEVLFEREAGVLYQLQHSQIPTFRELLRANFERQERLFLVQDYVDGQTYQSLLDQRQQEGKTFTEEEVRQFLLDILPVLEYIHSVNVIHRDISPDNLMMRASDGLPVLIDFGGVKQVATAVSSPASVTLVGKVGFAPYEQIRQGQTYPHSDLYALAATALVLLTGQPAQTLIGDNSSSQWLQQVTLSPRLVVTLEKMLASDPRDRFQTAKQVRVALSRESDSAPRYRHNTGGSARPGPSMPGQIPSALPTPPRTANSGGESRGWGGLVVALLTITIAGIGGWVGYRLLPQTADQPGELSPSDGDPAGQSRLETRRSDLGVNAGFLVAITDQTFYDRYPNQRDRVLTDTPDDAEWRGRWEAIADEWLTLIETNLSPQARQGLGSYTAADIERWTQAANALFVGRKALNDLTDAAFFHLLPQQRSQSIFDQPVGQIWYGIALDQLAAMQSRSTLSTLSFSEGNYREESSGLLAPGRGQIYIMELSESQLLRVNLQAPQGQTRLSIYLPSPTADQPALLERSRQLTWSGKLSQSGFYEVVITSTASDTIAYQLNVSADVVTQPAPAAPAEEAPDSPAPDIFPDQEQPGEAGDAEADPDITEPAE